MFASDVERWAWVTRQQLDAFDGAFQPWLASVRSDPFANSFEGEAGMLQVRFTTAAYFAMIAAHQLGKALRLASAAEYDAELFERVQRLRDIFEHWEQHRGSFVGLDRSRARRVAAGYVRDAPTGNPWMVQWDGDGEVTLGEILRLSELRVVLDRL